MAKDDNKCSYCHGTGKCQHCTEDPYRKKQCDYCHGTRNCLHCYGSGRK